MNRRYPQKGLPNLDIPSGRTSLIAVYRSIWSAFDVKPCLKIGIFRELQDQRNFNSVWPFLGSIRWQNGQDFCPDTLYRDRIPVPALQRAAAQPCVTLTAAPVGIAAHKVDLMQVQLALAVGPRREIHRINVMRQHWVVVG